MEKDPDVAEGVNNTRYRMLDTRIGRWMSVDPAAAMYYSWSPYNLSMDNPLVNSDPSGATVIIGYSPVIGPFKHAFIYRVYEDGSKKVLVEGMPENWVGTDAQKRNGYGNLVNDRLHADDGATLEERIAGSEYANPEAWPMREISQDAKITQVVPIPKGMTEDELEDALVASANKYEGDVAYKITPYVRKAQRKTGKNDIGNSNSVVGTALRDNKIHLKPKRWLPGYKADIYDTPDISNKEKRKIQQENRRDERKMRKKEE